VIRGHAGEMRRIFLEVGKHGDLESVHSQPSKSLNSGGAFNCTPLLWRQRLH
jgi:hypothetical protein